MLKQFDDNSILYRMCGIDNDSGGDTESKKLLTEYFQLNLNVTQSFVDWCGKDSLFKKAATNFYGIRVLKQDLVENIFSFICSSNNNISR